MFGDGSTPNPKLLIDKFVGLGVGVVAPKPVGWLKAPADCAKSAKLDGMESKCFQHECDHLDGITFNKRVSKLRWEMAQK